MVEEKARHWLNSPKSSDSSLREEESHSHPAIAEDAMWCHPKRNDVEVRAQSR